MTYKPEDVAVLLDAARAIRDYDDRIGWGASDKGYNLLEDLYEAIGRFLE